MFTYPFRLIRDVLRQKPPSLDKGTPSNSNKLSHAPTDKPLAGARLDHSNQKRTKCRNLILRIHLLS
ncbi:hypothetical protein JTE90_014719 [Oedothorax gibbosus]|uniref:Uncharacterized protein n=1 Tax=Oedothorax gibbosus TaxID=931172 RepID=A0AAV6USD0_9ARAC|nr:hypothetical protein JTE90_014719 [Oedothorax gibbosus]